MQAAALSSGSANRHIHVSVHCPASELQDTHLVLNKIRVNFPSFLSRHRYMDDDIVSLFPVNRGCHLVLIGELKGWKRGGLGSTVSHKYQ